ncbi:translation elongation factor Ts [Sunxiuqinia elliptica]|uniref:Elongation factor Ts n=1 Tax=Sunxiuqinia elliptica TaxID=655355 RepID=A0A1I2ASV8_9BACT|nr:translation elongation factor Ts [Sunxiuqinia elliptica]TDO02793.1 elongation factor Ts [Sunxiuqinia elliptica]TDO58468.1 elongation factor Ts [Sunxiuqinia elliptica]SFE46839.1 elongation factor Ts [Sunxiuqinia elliptica]
MAISAADVMKLRKATGAGMMDCKNALADANGDFDAAVQIIREKGKLVANKRSDREASEGVALAGVSEDNQFGAIVVLNCETDFVAKNEDFVKTTQKFLDAALANKPADLEALKAIEVEGRTIESHVTEQTGVIGEKIELSFYGKIEAGAVVPYIHPGNKLATLVGFNKGGVDTQVMKDVAMQVAAMSPVAVDKDNVAPEVVEKELEIAKEKFRQEGKPEAMLDKIAQGSLNKFFKENTLLNQAFVKDNKQTVKEYLVSADKDLSVTEFIRFALSE